jgi:hypothetical protein
MIGNRSISHTEQATECRRQALNYSEKPEGALLLRVAQAFEALAAQEKAQTEFRVRAPSQRSPL